jgi:uncharacterized repeat protein (TIGR01451 family)
MSWNNLLGGRRKQTLVSRFLDRDRLHSERRRLRPTLEDLENRVLPAVQAVSLADPSMLSDTAAGNVQGQASVSKDGRYVVYTDTAANLASGQVVNSKSAADVYLFDRATGTTTLVSHRASTGSSDTNYLSTPADGTSKNAVISADGKWIAYISNSDNLVSGETLANDTYYVSLGWATGGTFKLTYGGQTATIPSSATAGDVQTYLAGLQGIGNSANVSVTGSGGTQGGYTITFTGSLAHGAATPLTFDGSNLTISSSFSAIDPSFGGGHNEFLCDQYWVFLYNVQTGATTLASHIASDQATSGTSTTVAPGTSGLLTGFGNSFGTTNGVVATQATSVSISGDGSYVAYMSTAANLVVGEQDVNISSLLGRGYYVAANVFVYDRSADTNYLVSHKYNSPTNTAGAATTPGDYTSFVATISQDGTAIAFGSQDTNLAQGQGPSTIDGHGPGETEQFFVANRSSGSTWGNATTSLVSHNTRGNAIESVISSGTDLLDYPAPAITPDGHWIAYESTNDIVTPDSVSYAAAGDNYYLYDNNSSDTGYQSNTLVSHIPSNTLAAGSSYATSSTTTTAPGAAISDDGRFVAFASRSNNLTSSTTSAGWNYFVFDRQATDTTHNVTLINQASVPTSAVSSTSVYPVLTPSISGDGRYIAYLGLASSEISPPPTNVNVTNGLDALVYDQGSTPGTSTPTRTLLSHSSSSTTTTGNGVARTPVINENGNTIVYPDEASNLGPSKDLNAALPHDGVDLFAYSLTTPSGYTPQASNGSNATATLHYADSAHPANSLPSLTANGMSEISPVHAVSDNGRYTVYMTNAPNLVAGEVDTNLSLNVYLYDKQAGTTTLLSHAAGSSSTTGNGPSSNAVISGDGSTVLFYSFATNLISGGTPSGDVQLYMYNVSSGTLSLVSHTSGSSTQGANSTAPFSYYTSALGFSTFFYSTSTSAQGLALPSISDNGQYIAYLSNATNLSGSNTGTNKINVFLYDNNSSDSAYGTNIMVSTANGATTTANANADTVAISSDGTTIAFTDKATNLLGTSITTTYDQLYVWSRTTNSTTGLSAGQTVLASHQAGSTSTAATISGASTGSPAWGPLPASLSSNGAFVAYYFGGSNLVSSQGGTASALNVFRYDVVNNANTLVSHASSSTTTAGDNPTNANLYEASGPAISANGRYIAFANNSTNLLGTSLSNQNGQDNVYLYDANTGTNTLVSHASGSTTTPDSAGGTSPSISSDGRFVSFIDLALNNNSDTDCTFVGPGSVRLYDGQASGSTQPAVVGRAFDASTMLLVGATLAPTAMSSDGTTVVWDGLSATNVTGDLNSNLDVFLDVPGGSTSSTPNLTVTKTATATNPSGGTTTGTSISANSGDAVSYTITISNTGSASASGVSLNDPLPTLTGVNWTGVTTSGPSGTAQATLSNGTVSDTIGTLAANATVTFVISGTTSAGASGTLNNTVTVTSTNNSPSTLTSSATITLKAPQVSVTKTATATNPSGGTTTGTSISANATDAVSYTITVSNSGTGAAYGVNLSDPLPTLSGVTWTGVTTNGPSGTTAATLSNGTVSDNLGTLAANATVTFTITGTTARGTSGSLSNTATVTSTNNSTSSLTSSATITVKAPQVAVTKTATVTNPSGTQTTGTSISANATDAVSYTITVSNSGTGAAYGVNLSDPLPTLTGVTWTGVTTSGPSGTTAATLSNGTVSDNLGTLAANATVTFVISGTTSAGASGSLSNTATVTSTNNSTSSLTSSATITVRAPQVAITKTATATNPSGTQTSGTNISANATDAVSYTITVSNSGTGTAYGVSLSDPLPTLTGVTWTGVTTNGSSGTPSATLTSGTVSDNLGALAANATVTFTVTGTTTAGTSGSLSNTATVTSTNNSTSSLTSTAVITVKAPQLAITKTATATNPSGTQTTGTSISANATDAVSYTITVSNSGGGAAYQVNISDPLPTLTGVNWTGVTTNGPSGTPQAFISSTGSVMDNLGTLASGATVTFTVSGTTTSSTSGTLNNTATVTSTNNSTSSLTASAVITVRAPQVAITKTATATNPSGTQTTGASISANATDAVSYTITVSNSGTGAAYQVNLSDPLPALTGVSWTGVATNGPSGTPQAFITSTGTVMDNLGTLPANTTVTFTVSGTTTAGTNGTLSNTATVTSTNNSTSSLTASAVITVKAPQLTVTKTATTTNPSGTQTTGTNINANATDAVSYTIVVSNSGTGAAYQVNVNDPLPTLTGVTWTGVATSGPSGTPQAFISSTGTVMDNLGTLAASTTVTFVVSGTTTSSTSGTLSNTATVTSTNNNPGTLTSSATITVNGPHVTVTKTATATNPSGAQTTGTSISANATDALSYTITVSNTGNAAAYGVNLSDPLPSLTGVNWTGVTTSGPSGTAQAFISSTGTVMDNLGTLPANTTVTFTVSGTTAAGTSGTLNNTATVTANNNSTVTASAVITVKAPQLAVTKTATATNPSGTQTTGTSIGASPTDAVSYTITVSNSGTGAAYQVNVNDPLPTLTGVNWTGVTTSGPSGTPQAFISSTGTLMDNLGTMPANTTVTFTVSGTTTSSTSGTLSNTATVTSNNNSPGTLNASATIVFGGPHLTITKSATATNPSGTQTTGASISASATDAVSYTITVGNTGGGAAYQVNFSDPLPSLTGVTWTGVTTSGPSGTPQAFISSTGTVMDNLGTLPANTTVTFTVTGTTAVGTSGTLNNTATVTANNNSPGSLTASATINVSAPQVTVTKTATATNPSGTQTTGTSITASATDALSYTITVSNTGAAAAYQVNLNDPLPTLTGVNWTGVTTSGPSGTPQAFITSTGTVMDNLGTLAGNTTVTFTVSGTTSVGTTGTLDNTATVTSANTNPGTFTSSAVITVKAPQLAITKTAAVTNPSGTQTTGASVVANSTDALSYTITVSNTGTGAAYQVNVDDPLPSLAGVNWTGVTTSGPSGTPQAFITSTGTLMDNLGTLAANTTVTFTVSGTTAAGTNGTLNNTATVTSSNNSTSSLTASAVITIKAPQLAVSKTASVTNPSGVVTTGSNVVAYSTDHVGYTITVSNTGGGAAYQVNVNDPLPSLPGVTWSTSVTTNGPSGTPQASISSTGALIDNLGTLASGATVTFTVTGTTAAGANGALNNTATVTSTNNSPSSLTGSATITVKAPQLTLTKSANGTTFNPTGPIGYTIVISNNGTGVAYGVNVTDPLPTATGVSWTGVTTSGPSGTPQATFDSTTNTVSDALGTLAPGATVTFVVSGATTNFRGALPNTATATSTNNSPGTLTASATIAINVPSLSVTKTATVTNPAGVSTSGANISANATDQIGYTITVSNTGNAGATLVNVNDPLPTLAGVNWTGVTTSGPSGTPQAFISSTGTLMDNLGTVAAGTTVTFTVTGTTSAGTSGTLNNTVTVTASNTTPGTFTASAVITIKAPQLTVAKTASVTNPVGVVTTGSSLSANATDQVGYTITVSNTGGGAAYQVNLNDPLPSLAGVTWTGVTTNGPNGTPQASISSGALVDNLGTLASGATVTFTLTGTTAAGTSGALNNTATVTSTNNGPSNLTASALITVNAPQLAVTKTASVVNPAGGVTTGSSLSANAADAISYTITVSNSGTGAAYQVNLNDPLPSLAGVTWTGVTTSGPSGTPQAFISSSGALMDNLGTFAAGATVTFTVTGTTSVGTSGTLSNTATVISTNNNPGTLRASAAIAVQAPQLIVTKTAAAVNPGGGVTSGTSISANATDAISYTITVSNAGAGAAYLVNVSDPLPSLAGVTWTGVSTNGPSGTPQAFISSTGSVMDNLGTLAGNTTVTFTITGTTTVGTSGNLTNTATVTAGNINPGTLNATTVIAVKAPQLTVTKTATATNPSGVVTTGSSINANATDQVGYTITVSNTGGGAAYQVNLNDPLPSLSGVNWTGVVTNGPSGTPQAFISSTGTLMDNLGTLASGATVTFTVTGTTATDTSGTLNNTATVTSSNINPSTLTASATITLLTPTLNIIKTGNAPVVNSADPISFTIIVSNTGTGAAYGVNVSDNLPVFTGVNWTGVSTTAPTGTPQAQLNSNAVTDAIGTLAAGDTVKIVVSGTTDAGFSGILVNNATATSSNNDPGSLQATAKIIVAAPQLTVTKTGNAFMVRPTDPVSFTIVVSNTGAGDAYDVAVDDLLPIPAPGVSWTLVATNSNPTGAPAATLNSAGTELTDDLGTLAPNTTVTIEVFGTTASSFSGKLQNTVTVRSTNNAAQTSQASALINVAAPPTDILLSNGVVEANQAVGTVVGQLSVADGFPNQGFTYSLTGANAGLFQIVGNNIVTNTVFHSGTVPVTYSVGVHVVDSLGQTFDKVLTITVDPIPAIATQLPLDSGGNPTALEGATINLVGTAFDSRLSSANINYTWAVSDNGSPVAFSASGANLSFAAMLPGTYTVTMVATDADGNLGTALPVTIDVTNVAPTVSSVPSTTIGQDASGNAAFATTVSFTDPGNDGWNVTIDYGDGTVTSFRTASRSVDLSHSYTQSQIYTGAIAVTDDSGATGFSDFVVNVLKSTNINGAQVTVTNDNGGQSSTPVVSGASGTSVKAAVTLPKGMSGGAIFGLASYSSQPSSSGGDGSSSGNTITVPQSDGTTASATGIAFFDVRAAGSSTVLNATTLTVTFSYLSTTDTPGQQTLYYQDSAGDWHAVLSDNGSGSGVAPTETVVTNADGTFTHFLSVTFGPNSNPPITALTGTVFTFVGPVSSTPKVDLVPGIPTNTLTATNVPVVPLPISDKGEAAGTSPALLSSASTPSAPASHFGGDEQEDADALWQRMLRLGRGTGTPAEQAPPPPGGNELQQQPNPEPVDLQRLRDNGTPAPHKWQAPALDGFRQGPAGDIPRARMLGLEKALADGAGWLRGQEALRNEEESNAFEWQCALAAIAVGGSAWAEPVARRGRKPLQAGSMDNDND